MTFNSTLDARPEVESVVVVDQPPSQGNAYDRYIQLVEIPMTVLAFLMLPVLLVPLVHPLHGTLANSFEVCDYTIWALFAADYVARLCLANRRFEFVRKNVFDLALVALPFLRPLRIVRGVRALQAIRVLRMMVLLETGLKHAREVLSRKGLQYVLLVVLAVVCVGAGIELAAERNASGATIHNYGDALWWAMTTITTVGYGDKYPVTAAGRGVAVALMVTGIALFGVVTATIASYFVEQDHDKRVDERIDEILETVRRLESNMNQSVD